MNCLCCRSTTYCCSPGSQPLRHGYSALSLEELLRRRGLTVVDSDGVGIMSADEGDISKRAVAKIRKAVAGSCSRGR